VNCSGEEIKTENSCGGGAKNIYFKGRKENGMIIN